MVSSREGGRSSQGGWRKYRIESEPSSGGLNASESPGTGACGRCEKRQSLDVAAQGWLVWFFCPLRRQRCLAEQYGEVMPRDGPARRGVVKVQTLRPGVCRTVPSGCVQMAMSIRAIAKGPLSPGVLVSLCHSVPLPSVGGAVLLMCRSESAWKTSLEKSP